MVIITPFSLRLFWRQNEEEKQSVVHLSTALTPSDREKIVESIKKRLDDKSDNNWTIVATSCVESGMDSHLPQHFGRAVARPV